MSTVKVVTFKLGRVFEYSCHWERAAVPCWDPTSKTAEMQSLNAWVDFCGLLARTLFAHMQIKEISI